MTVLIRPARPDDVPALVRLRRANAEHHVGLRPSAHRLPDPEAVRRHFEARRLPDDLLLIAELDETGPGGTGPGGAGPGGAGPERSVAGMAEVVIRPEPPDHQILVPCRTAEVHTVVLDGFRGRGVGRALLAAAERTATAHGVEFLLAVIADPNEEAVAFYTAAGFGPHGLLLGKNTAAPGRAVGHHPVEHQV